MNLGNALLYGRSVLANSADPYLDARLLLESATELKYVQIIANSELELDVGQQDSYLQKLQRAAAGEPIPYITGRANFADFEILVTPAVLIPRQETELLAAAALEWINNCLAERSTIKIADVGTGSGCIAIYLAKKLKRARIEAVDISKEALHIARMNAKRHHVLNQIGFYHGNLLEPVQSMVDLLVANLPYVADHEWSDLNDSVKWYEPTIALKGGENGLEVIFQLLNSAREALAPRGAIFLEIGWQQGKMAHELAQEIYPQAKIKVSADFSGNDRVLSIFV